MKERETSQLANELNCRINTNQAFGDNDMTLWLLDKLQLKKGEQVLDIGCGTGKILIAFAKQIRTDFACSGIDISAESLKKAEEAANKEAVKIKFINVVMDKLALLVSPKKYDTITAIYAAYYSQNVQQLLKNLNKMLNSGGRIVIMGPYLDNNKKLFEFLNKFMTLPERAAKSTTTFMFEEILPFAYSNFEEVKSHKFINNISIPSLDDLRIYWRSSTYYNEKYDGQFEKYANEHFSQHDSFSFRKVALLVEMKHTNENVI